MATKKKEQSVFEVLSAVDVSKHINKKNNLSYLPWAWAWGEVKKRYPLAVSKTYYDPRECNYWTDGVSAWVRVGVTIEGLEHIEDLAVMDYRNNSITMDKIRSTDVVKAIQRCATKAIGRHGLGFSIYAGEDLPEQHDVKPVGKTHVDETPAEFTAVQAPQKAEDVTPSVIDAKPAKSTENKPEAPKNPPVEQAKDPVPPPTDPIKWIKQYPKVVTALKEKGYTKQNQVKKLITDCGYNIDNVVEKLGI